MCNSYARGNYIMWTPQKEIIHLILPVVCGYKYSVLDIMMELCACLLL